MRIRPNSICCLLGATLFLSAAPFLSAQSRPGQAQSAPAAKAPSKAAVPAKVPAKSAGSGSASVKPTKSASAKSSKKKGTAAQTRARRQTAPTSARIIEIQSALAQAGHYQGEPNGKWDAASVEAMKKFQEANGLPVSGKFDAKSLQKLGLGSQVAGLAAPRPADSASPNRP